MIYFMEEYPVHSLERICGSVLGAIITGYISAVREGGSWVTSSPDSQKKTGVSQPKEVTFPLAPRTRITPLSLKDVPHVYESSFHKALTSLDYIRERISRGPNAGVYESGKPVAWAMTHDDASIGVMNVLQPYRRKRYAYDLTVYLIQQVRARGKIPYVHVEETNLISLDLAHKVGFRTGRRLHWFEIKA